LYDFGFAQFASISANSEAAPEYRSRSVLMSGNDYILIFDDVSDSTVEGRFSWFVGTPDSFPYIHQLTPGVKPIYNNQPVTDQGDINLGRLFLKGRYYDGKGDFLTLVTHREDVNVSLRNSVCDVKRGDESDLVFRGDRNIIYSQSGKIFKGTAGIIRYNEASGEYESALFIGDKLGIPGISVQWYQKPGYGGFSIKKSATGYQGFIQVTSPASLQFTLDAKPGKDFVFYLNGIPSPVEISQKNEFIIKVDRGKHSWQWTNAGVIPSAPVIKNTCTADTWSDVKWFPVAGASGYDLQVSTDGENTWLDVANGIEDTRYKLTGLTDGKKVHIRVIARGKGGQSEPSNSYPVYPSSSVPHAPDGLLAVKDGARVNLSWGHILGANRYTLYRRIKGSSEFQEVYSGEEHNAGITLQDTSVIYEFCVTATNGVGESRKSVISDTDESRIINWYPVPGETYRRVTESYEQGYAIWNNWIEQALPVLKYPVEF